MGKVIVIEHLTLDGVMQAPGRLDEDPRDGFRYGGWAGRSQDPAFRLADSATTATGVIMATCRHAGGLSGVGHRPTPN